MIHKVKAPFMSRHGQFVEGEHTLCIGIDFSTINKEKTHRFTIGKNDDVVYEITLEKIVNVAQIWESPKNKKVFITPVNECKIISQTNSMEDVSALSAMAQMPEKNWEELRKKLHQK